MRYFSFVLLAVLTALAYLLTDLLASSPSRAKLAVTGICAILVIIPLWRPVVDWHDYRDVKQARAFVDAAKRDDIHFIAGSYWRTWPTVLALMDDGMTAYGLADRAEGNGKKLRAAIMSDISQGRAPRALCLEAAPAACVAMTSSITHMAWFASSEQCGAPACTIIHAADVGPK